MIEINHGTSDIKKPYLIHVLDKKSIKLKNKKMNFVTQSLSSIDRLANKLLSFPRHIF
jgi:hypothetical protein